MAEVAGPSNPNPENLFQFTITPLTQFKPALEALIDQDFNPIGHGIIEVKEDGVDFTAQNIDTEVTGILRVNSAALKDFHFNRRCKEKLMWISFRQIVLNISDNDESITFYFDWSYNIIYRLGNDPLKMFDLELLTMPPEFERFALFTYICAAVMPSNMPREMVDRLDLLLLLGINEIVSASVSQMLASVCIGDMSQPQWRQYYDNWATGTMGLVPGQIHHALFTWPHLNVLRKAARLAPFFELRFVSLEREMVSTQFNLQELGYLGIACPATKIFYNSDKIPLDANIIFDNNNSQIYDADAFRHENEITPEPILEQLPTNVDLSADADKLNAFSNPPSKLEQEIHGVAQGLVDLKQDVADLKTRMQSWETKMEEMLKAAVTSLTAAVEQSNAKTLDSVKQITFQYVEEGFSES